MRLHSILLEYDNKITAQKQGPALTARWLEDGSAKRDVDGHSAKTPEEILEFLEYADPTKNKQYMLWIVKEYLAKRFMFEDIEGLKEELELYHTIKPRIPVIHRDIGRFDLGSFREMMVAYSGGEGGDFELAGDLDKQDAEILVNSPQGVLARAKSEKGACELGKGTKWCTASTDGGNYADDYIGGSVTLEEPYGDGLFIYWEYPGKKKYQIHVGDADIDNGDYGEEGIPAITVMDAQDMTVFSKEPDWLLKRANHPVLKGLIQAIKNKYADELRLLDMWADADVKEEYYDDDAKYFNFFDGWQKLFPKGPNKEIEAKILAEMPAVTKMDIAKRKGEEKRYYRDLTWTFLDMNRFKFGLQYVSNLRGNNWPQIDKIMISEFNTIGSALAEYKDINKKFIREMDMNFIKFHDELNSYVQRGILSKAVPDTFRKNFFAKFEDPELLNNSHGSDVIHNVNELWGDEYFAPQMKGQTSKRYGVDIKSMPKAPPVPLQNLPMVKLFSNMPLTPLPQGFNISFASIIKKGIWNREANLFDRMRHSMKKLGDMSYGFARDLPEVSLYGELTNPRTANVEDTPNGPLLIELQKQLKDAGLSEYQVLNFVGAPAQGYSRSWNWGKADPSIIEKLMGNSNLASYGVKNSGPMGERDYDPKLLKAVYDILDPYMYDVQDDFYTAIVDNLRSSPLGQTNNPILEQMFKELGDLKNNGTLAGVFRLAEERCRIAGEQFALQAGQPVQLDDKGFVSNETPRPEIEDAQGNTLDYIRRGIIQNSKTLKKLPLIAPDLTDSNTKKIYLDISNNVAGMDPNDVMNFEFSKPKTQRDIDKWEELYRSFKPLHTTPNDLQGE